MNKKFIPAFMMLLIILSSILIMILPTFFTKGVSRISLNKELNLPLILNSDKNISLVFFGYSGCSEICTPRLSSLSDFYNTLNKETRDKIDVQFLDISTPFDNTLPKRFAEFFHSDFKGLYLNSADLRVYTRAFDVYFSPSLTDKMEYDHTANLYLLKRNFNKKKLKYIYSAYPYDFKQIQLDIEELINE